MAKDTYTFLLRFDINDKKESAVYKKLFEAAYENGRSVNKEVLQTLKTAYLGKK